MTVSDRRAGAVNDDVGLGRLQCLGRVVLNLQAEPSIQADDVAEIAPDLRRIDVDPADDLESRSRRDLSGDGGSQSGRDRKCITRMVDIAANYSPTVGATIAGRDGPDDHIPAGISRFGGPGAGPPNPAGSAPSPGVRRRRPAPLAAQRQLLDRRAARSGDADDHRDGDDRLAEHHDAGRPTICDFTSTGTPGRTRDRTFLREAALSGPIDRPAEDFARMEVTSIKLLRDVSGTRARKLRSISRRRSGFIAPDDGNADDETVMAVPLPEPVPPGGSVDDRADMDRARAAALRPDRRHRQLLFHRAVVSEARRFRGTRLELSPVPLDARSSFPITASTMCA